MVTDERVWKWLSDPRERYNSNPLLEIQSFGTGLDEVSAKNQREWFWMEKFRIGDYEKDELTVEEMNKWIEKEREEIEWQKKEFVKWGGVE